MQDTHKKELNYITNIAQAASEVHTEIGEQEHIYSNHKSSVNLLSTGAGPGTLSMSCAP